MIKRRTMFSGRLDGGCDARSGFGEADATTPFIFGNEIAENDPESGDGNARAKAQRRKDQRLLTIQALSGAVQSFTHWVNSLAPTFRSQRPALCAFAPLCEKSDSRFQDNPETGDGMNRRLRRFHGFKNL